MAVTASGLFYITFRDALSNTIALDLGAEDHKIALISNSATPAFDTHDHWSDLSGNEVSGTGWAAGGVALTGTAFSVSSGTLLWDATDVSETGTTLTNARAGVIYADSITNDPLICLVNFGADYSTSAGTFSITWSASPAAIFTIDLTP
jgi:hypothetical protein